MRHMCNQPRFWKRPTTFLIITATMATAVILMSPGGLEAANPALEAIQSQISGLQSQISGLQSQISGLPPAWDKTLPANDPGGACPSNSSRFTCVPAGVIGGRAVLDRETGLVWEQSPDTTTRTWLNAQIHCNQKTVGNRKGWRLPTIQELASLIDPTVFTPALPADHPFSNVQSSDYWSATTSASDSTVAWIVRVNLGDVVSVPKSSGVFDLLAWCVRGGQGVDPQ